MLEDGRKMLPMHVTLKAGVRMTKECFIYLLILLQKYTYQLSLLAYSPASRGGQKTLEHKVIQ